MVSTTPPSHYFYLSQEPIRAGLTQGSPTVFHVGYCVLYINWSIPYISLYLSTKFLTMSCFPLDCHIPKGYVSFPAMGDDKQETKLSHRDVTSPINPDDYKESSESRGQRRGHF